MESLFTKLTKRRLSFENAGQSSVADATAFGNIITKPAMLKADTCMRYPL